MGSAQINQKWVASTGELPFSLPTKMAWVDLAVTIGAIIGMALIVTCIYLAARMCCCIWPTCGKPGKWHKKPNGNIDIGVIKQPCCLCCHIWADTDYEIDQFRKPETGPGSIPHTKEEAKKSGMNENEWRNAGQTQPQDDKPYWAKLKTLLLLLWRNLSPKNN